MIIAADESLACSKLERLKGKALVIYYKREVPLKPIIEHLREREARSSRQQVERLEAGGEGGSSLKGDVVSIEEIAGQKGVAAASLKMALQGLRRRGVREGRRPASSSRGRSWTR